MCQCETSSCADSGGWCGLTCFATSSSATTWRHGSNHRSASNVGGTHTSQAPPGELHASTLPTDVRDMHVKDMARYLEIGMDKPLSF